MIQIVLVDFITNPPSRFFVEIPKIAVLNAATSSTNICCCRPVISPLTINATDKSPYSRLQLRRRWHFFMLWMALPLFVSICRLASGDYHALPSNGTMLQKYYAYSFINMFAHHSLSLYAIAAS
jgi:hypothetical protein